MTRLLVAVAAVAMLAVPAASFAAAAKKATPKAETKKEDPKKAEPAKDTKPADAKPTDAKAAAPDAGAPAPKGDAKQTEKLEVQKIGKLGLKFEGPKMSQQDMSGQIMCSDDHGLAFTVGPTNDFSVKTFEEAKLAKNDYSPTNVMKEEKLADGWNIQFQNKGAMGDNFFVWIRRNIAGKAYQCETTSTTAEQAAKIEKICLSLSKQ